MFNRYIVGQQAFAPGGHFLRWNSERDVAAAVRSMSGYHALPGKQGFQIKEDQRRVWPCL
jgi:hypothetical protein